MGAREQCCGGESAELRFSVLELKCQWLIAQHLEMGDWSSQEAGAGKVLGIIQSKWQVNQESSCMHIEKVASIAGSRSLEPSGVSRSSGLWTLSGWSPMDRIVQGGFSQR